MMLHEQEIVQQLMSKLKELLFDFAILGGYPRDIHFGREPKDLDICVFNYHPHDVAEQQFFNMLYQWCLKNGIKVNNHESAPSAEGDTRVYHVLSLDIGVDIIFWNAKTKLDVVMNFDFNINQFELNPETNEVIDMRSPSWADNELIMMRSLYEYTTDPTERILHVIKIAKEIGWDTCSEENSLKSMMRNRSVSILKS